MCWFFKNFYVFLNLRFRKVTIGLLVPQAFDHHTADIYVGVFRKNTVRLAGVRTCERTRP